MPDWIKEIEGDLNWREAELVAIKKLVFSVPRGSVREEALLRALWALLYAHYEGFCKFVWDLYLDALENEKIMRLSCQDNIACLSLQQDFKRLKGNLSPDALWSFCVREFPQLLSKPAIFPIKLDTQFNLWPDVFLKNARKVSLPTRMIDEHGAKIRALVARRNEIAHGKRMVIRELSEYQKYEKSALLVMHELAVGVSEALENKNYIKTSSTKGVC